MVGEAEEQLRAYVEYFRDLGVYDFYRRGEPVAAAVEESVQQVVVEVIAPQTYAIEAKRPVEPQEPASTVAKPTQQKPVPTLVDQDSLEPSIPKLVSFNNLTPLPVERLAAANRPAALKAIQEEIGDCTRCPLAYAGRHKIVFADGDPNARLMFVGEGPGADEDAQGLPFVGKAGQLLNNMIAAMGVKREQVYIANIVKCRPPGNRTPEPVEATTCSQFLVKQIDVVQPEVIVALGSTAATYLLGVKQSLSGLRGRWHSCRGAKLAVTYHPAFLLRDPRQKAEAWKDLQMVMKEMGLKAPAKG
jgi:DNA polymerase